MQSNLSNLIYQQQKSAFCFVSKNITLQEAKQTTATMFAIAVDSNIKITKTILKTNRVTGENDNTLK